MNSDANLNYKKANKLKSLNQMFYISHDSKQKTPLDLMVSHNIYGKYKSRGSYNFIKQSRSMRKLNEFLRTRAYLTYL